MVKKRSSVPKAKKERLINSVKQGNINEFSKLCSKRVLKSLRNNIPLWMYVVSIGNEEIVKYTVRTLLSENSKNSNESEKEEIKRKFKGRWIEVILAVKRKEALEVMCKEFKEKLLEERDFFSGKKEKLINQILIELSKENKEEEVEILFREFLEEINVNIQDDMANTPLHYGAYRGNEKLVKILVKHGGRLDIQNSIGLTPEGILRFKGVKIS